MKTRFLSNPNYIYILAFLSPFLVYSLQWSTIYPKLTAELFLFFLSTFSICIIIGFFFKRATNTDYNSVPVAKNNWFIVSVVLFVYFIEFCYSRYIPLLSFSAGAVYGEDSFGIPTVHVLLVTFNVFYAIYLFHQYISSRKRSLLFYYFLLIIPLILVTYRSSIMYIVTGSFTVYLLSQKKVSFKKILLAIFIVLFVFWGFGYLGNLRSGNGDPTYIPRASGATTEFLDSWVPKEFYWAYLYIGSPIANLENNIDLTKDNTKPEYKGFFFYELTPDFVSKKIASPKDKREFNQINEFLNVGTIYANAFSYLRWNGVYFMFFLLIFVGNVYFYLINKSKTYRVTGMAIMGNLILFSTYSNTLVYSAASFQLIYPLLLSFLKRKKTSDVQ